MSNYLVLVQNEATKGGDYDFWEDNTGEQYHYPNTYKNKVLTGSNFIYYKSRLRKDGSYGEAGYFGFGTIGEIFVSHIIGME